MLRFKTSFLFLAFICHGADLDLSKATVILDPTSSVRDRKAAQVLIEEVEKRSQIRWSLATRPTPSQAPSIYLKSGGKGAAEGYEIKAQASGVTITASDERGLLFGVGHLLRTMHLTPGRIGVSDTFSVATAPKYPLRGHQLGYRPKTNSYDGWSAPVWDQYIRDLAVFGTNAIELLPPRTDDAALSPHFPLPPMDMMIEMSRICDEYGMDVWIWY